MMRVGGKVEGGGEDPGRNGPWDRTSGRKKRAFRARRRGPYTERQWYDERIGGRPWDVEGKRVRKRKEGERERAKCSGKGGKERKRLKRGER